MRRTLAMSCIVALAALALAGEIQPINQTVVVNDTKVTLRKKAASPPLFEVVDVTAYEAVSAGTEEVCAVITGYLISHLPSHSYDVDLTLSIARVLYVPGQPGGAENIFTYQTSIHCPVPNKRTRFVILGKSSCFEGNLGLVPAHMFSVAYRKYSALDGDKGGK